MQAGFDFCLPLNRPICAGMGRSQAAEFAELIHRAAAQMHLNESAPQRRASNVAWAPSESARRTRSDALNPRKSIHLIFRQLVLLIVAVVCGGAATVGLPGQVSVPNGTILPIRLSTSLSSRKSKPGQVITGHIMQDVLLGPESKISRGARVTGHVVGVTPAAGGGNAQVSIALDAVQLGHSTVPIVTDLRAIASPLEIENAQVPDTGPDRGTPPSAFTTVQVGGEVVYRGGGPVARGETAVGQPVPNGVLVDVGAAEGQPCRGVIGGNRQPQALWLFSSDACGVYGYPQVAIAHAGRTNPAGQIVLSSTDGRDLSIRAGSGMLLRVNDH
jgi:hypothetical protein